MRLTQTIQRAPCRSPAWPWPSLQSVTTAPTAGSRDDPASISWTVPVAVYRHMPDSALDQGIQELHDTQRHGVGHLRPSAKGKVWAQKGQAVAGHTLVTNVSTPDVTVEVQRTYPPTISPGRRDRAQSVSTGGQGRSESSSPPPTRLWNRQRSLTPGSPAPALPPPTRSRSVSDSSLLGHIHSGNTLLVARRVCDRHPTPNTTEDVFVLVTGLWRSNEVSPCKRLANTSGPMGDAGRRHERPDAPDRHRDVPFAGSFAGGALSSFPRSMARCRPTAWLRSFCNRDAGPATCAGCRSVLSPAGAATHVLARMICARVLAGSGSSRVREIGIPEGVGSCQWGFAGSLWGDGAFGARWFLGETRAVPEPGSRLAGGRPGGAWP
jgi:hypothetical protein